MLPEITEPAQILAPLVALVVTYVLFYEGFIYKLGQDGEAFATIRSVLPMLDEEAREVGFYTSYTVTERELVGLLDTTRAEAMSLFYGLGFKDNPLAAHKENWAGQREIASLGRYYNGETFYSAETIENWNRMKRFVMLAFVIDKQLHVTLFQNAEGEVVVTAHYEWSPYNVFKAFEHFVGEDYNVEKGVSMTEEILSEAETI